MAQFEVDEETVIGRIAMSVLFLAPIIFMVAWPYTIEVPSDEIEHQSQHVTSPGDQRRADDYGYPHSNDIEAN